MHLKLLCIHLNDFKIYTNIIYLKCVVMTLKVQSDFQRRNKLNCKRSILLLKKSWIEFQLHQISFKEKQSQKTCHYVIERQLCEFIALK